MGSKSYRRWQMLELVAVVMVAGLCGCAPRTRETVRYAAHSSAVSTGLAGVDADTYRSHIEVLANDILTGRGIGSSGIDLAAGYIAGQFASIGIDPGAPNGTYFQEFEVNTGARLDDEGQFAFSGVDVSPVRETDFIPFYFSTDDAFDGDVVFVGYGIVNDAKDHHDYKSIDVSGKVVLMLRREPDSWTGDNGRGTRHAFFRSKIYTAREEGAAAVLIVNRPSDGDEDKLMPFAGQPGSYGLPAFHITRKLAGALLNAGGLATLEELQQSADKDEFVSAPLSGVRLKGRAGVEPIKTKVRNVVGVIRGEGRFADEYVVIGGHYDHLGIASPRSMFGLGGGGDAEIHNGADDNASGTAGVIEAGRMLALSKPLKRSVLLVTFTGEETGLLGSKYFVEHPPVPLDQMVAMLNMDMIGRFDDEKNTVQVFGTEAADEFSEMITRLTDSAGMKLRGDASALGPSDHTSFYQENIPSMHFFTGLHEDYHRPGDDVEKINAVGGARVTDLVVAMAKEIIDADARPTYHKVLARANIFGSPDQAASSGRPRVVMGIMPGYAGSSDKPGMVIDGVMEGGPAFKGGMKDEDRILKIGTMSVSNIQDYMGALRNSKPGDVVDVVVLRQGDEVPLKITLSGR